jgi:signal peptidase I
VAISLLVMPGVGHYFLGAKRAAAAWVGAFIACFLAVVVGAASSPCAFAVSVVLAALVQIGAAADLLRERATRPPPTARAVVVTIAAFALMVGVKSWVRVHVVESFRIPGSSMYPTLKAGDNVLVAKRRRTPVHGDVVAYRAVDGMPYMKRVMAIEWETIEVRGNEVWVNHRKLPQTASAAPCVLAEQCSLLNETSAKRTYPVAISTKDSTLNPKPELRVPLGHVFIMGDARRWSLDSRMTGPVPARDVIGTAEFVWWPPSRFGLRP